MDINKTKLYQNFVDIKNIANIQILTCYNKLFIINNLLFNIGSYILIAVLIFHIVSLFVFYSKQFDVLKKIIKDIISAIKKIRKNKKKKKYRQNNKRIIKDKDNFNKQATKEIKMNNNQKRNNINKVKNPIKKNNNNNNKKSHSVQLKGNSKKRRSIPLFIRMNPFCKRFGNKNDNQGLNNFKNNIKIIKKENKEKSIKFITTKNVSNISSKRNIANNSGIINANINKLKIIKKPEESILDYTEEEKNLLPYNLAKLHDNRSYCVYYISLLRTRHNLFFSFCQDRDYNSKIIKIDLFFIDFAILYAVNCLFFNDDSLHKIYETKGSFNLEYEIPKILYSSLGSMVINTIMKMLALSDNGVIELKQNKAKEDLDRRKTDLENNLRIKFILFFILGFLLLLFLWFYIGIFGVIYKNTQMHLLKDTLLSFGLSLIYPFFTYLIPGFLRIPALSDPKKDRKCLYDFSKFLQMF